MNNSNSKPLKQTTIGVFDAHTSQGHFRGWGLSNLQQHTCNHNYQGANIFHNNGNGNIVTGNAQVSNSLNTSVSNGSSAKTSNASNVKWGPRSENRYRADYNGPRQNYHTNRYYNGDRDDIMEKRKELSKKRKIGSMDNYIASNAAHVNDGAMPIDIDDFDVFDPNDLDVEDEVVFVKRQAVRDLGDVCKNHCVRRRTYAETEKETIIQFWKRHMENQGAYASQTDATAALHLEHPTWDTISTKMIISWIKAQDEADDGESINKNKGRKQCPDNFYDILKRKLWMKIVVMVHSKDTEGENIDVRVERILNCCYSYEIIANAAKEAKEEWLRLNPELNEKESGFNERQDVRKIVEGKEFSKKWVHGFLVQYCFHRRKISTNRNDAKIPDEDEVNSIMKVIQNAIESGKYPPGCVFSADETACNWDAALNYQYVTNVEIPNDIGDDKLRFTGMISTTAIGDTMAPFSIIRCSSKDPWDLRNTHVIDKLLTQLNSKHPGRFEKKIWERNIPFYNKKTRSTSIRKCVRPYIKDLQAVVVDGIHVNPIITCQNKAWMDQVGLIMWADVMMGAYVRQTKGKKAIIVWDNLSSHLSSIVKKILKEEHNIETVELPKNMTSLLQVCDLIINGPLKADQRRIRAKAIYNYFQWYAEEIIAHTNEHGVSYDIEWNPTRMSLVDGITTLTDSIASFNSRPDFKKAVADCFVNVGIVRRPDGLFNYYSRVASYKFLPSTLLKDQDDVDLEISEGITKFISNETFDLVCFENDIDEIANEIERSRLKSLRTEEDDDDEEAGEAADFVVPEVLLAEIAVAEVATTVAPTTLRRYTKEDTEQFKTKKSIMKPLNDRGFLFTPKTKLTLSQLKMNLYEWEPPVDIPLVPTVPTAPPAAIPFAPVEPVAAIVPPAVVPIAPVEPVAAIVPPAVVPIAPVAPIAPTVVDADKTYCFCNDVWNENDGRAMVECSNETCHYNRWFHFECLNQPDTWKPPNEWYCRRCIKIN